MLVAALTCLFATDIALTWCEALRTVLKQFFGSMLLAAKMYEVGTRKPEVEFGSPIPKSSVLSHLRMSSSFWNGDSALTRMWA